MAVEETATADLGKHGMGSAERDAERGQLKASAPLDWKFMVIEAEQGLGEIGDGEALKWQCLGKPR